MTQRFANYRHRVTLEKHHAEQAADGQPVQTWRQFVPDIPCHCEPTGGGEVRRGRQMDVTTSWLIRMRHPQDDFAMTTQDRLDYEGRKLNIVRAYDPTGMRAEWFVEAREYSDG